MTLCIVDAAKPQIAAVKATKSLKLGREVRFRRSVDHAHWLLIEADPEVGELLRGTGVGGRRARRLTVSRPVRAASRWRDRISLRGKVRTGRRPGASSAQGGLWSGGELPKHDRGSNFGGSRALGQCVAGDWPRLPVATRARAGLGGEG